MKARYPMIVLGLVCLLVAGSAVAAPTVASSESRSQAKTTEEGEIKLLLFLVVDQMPASFLERFRPLLTGGLKTLLEESVQFTDVHHAHNVTSTAPGHATLATGTHPSRHGLIGNYWFEVGANGEGQEIYCVRKSGKPSAERLLVPTIGAWLKAGSPESKVYAASGKDRAAILTGGQKADAAFWFDKNNGNMAIYLPERSRAAAREMRAWLDEFHMAEHSSQRFGDLWEAEPGMWRHWAEVGVEPLGVGSIQTQLPRSLGRWQAPQKQFFEDFYDSPFVDEYIARFARVLIEEGELGQDENIDFLGLSFSALDTVGHSYGPNSPEVFDALLKLDRQLGELLAFIDQKIGLEHVVISLSADHGITPLPEFLQTKGVAARRLGGAGIQCLQQVYRRVDAYFAARAGISKGEEKRLGLLLPGYYLNFDPVEKYGFREEEVLQTARSYLETCDGVRQVWVRSGDELTLEPSEAEDIETFGQIYKNGFFPDRSPPLVVQLERHTLASTVTATDHGSPYPYDSAVPWLLRVPGRARGEVSSRVHTVDVAPTLAALLGIEGLGEIDGTDRSGLLP